MKRHTTRKRNRKLLRAAWRRRHPRIMIKIDGGNLIVTYHGVTFVFFLDAPGDGHDLDYLDHVETATGTGDFDDWSEAKEGAMNPIDTLTSGDRARLEDILTAIYLALVW